MKRKEDVFKKIEWAQKKVNAIKESHKLGEIPDDLDSYIMLVDECLSHLNVVFDFCIKDFVESSGCHINEKFYFPFRKMARKHPLQKLPKPYKKFLILIIKRFKTEEAFPRTNVKYNLLRKMRKLVNEGKHNKISVKTGTENRGDLLFEFEGGTVLVEKAEQLEKTGFVVNQHMERKGNVPRLVFEEKMFLNEDERDVNRFCWKSAMGTELLMKEIYQFIERQSQNKD